MPISYHCDPTTRVTVSLWSDVTMADVTRYLDLLASDPNYASSRLLLSDLRSIARDGRPTRDQVDTLANAFLQRFGETMTTVKWAIVARHAFSDASIFDERVRDSIPRVLVFNDLGTACVWLGADVEQIEKTLDELRERSVSAPAQP